MTKKETRRKQSNSERKPNQPAMPRFVLMLGASFALLMMLSAWWMSLPTGEGGMAPDEALAESRGALVAQSTRIAAVDRLLPTATPTPVPTFTPVPPEIPLPTVTPTTVPPPVPGRVIEVAGDVTLRIVVGSGDFETTGRPVVLDIPDREVSLGETALNAGDRWCTQVGISSLIFDLIFTLEPTSQTLNVGGNVALHDGFCDKPGAQRAVSPVALAVPVGAAARVAYSLQTDEGMLDVTKLLNTNTSVYVEMLIRNPMPQ